MWAAAIKDAASSMFEKHSLELSEHFRLSISRVTIDLQEKMQKQLGSCTIQLSTNEKVLIRNS